MLKKTYTTPGNLTMTDAHFRVDGHEYRKLDGVLFLTVYVYKNTTEATADNPAFPYDITPIINAAHIATYLTDNHATKDLETRLEDYLIAEVPFFSDAIVV